MKPETPVIESILAKHDFTEEERLTMTDELTAEMSKLAMLEAELATIKSEYKGKTERAESQRDTLARKLRDKYEMRQAKAEVRFGIPSPGRKSYFYAEPTPGHDAGEFIREEAMSYSDLQRKLPLDDEQKVAAPEGAAPAAETSDDTPAPAPESGPLTTSIADRIHAAAAGAEVPLVKMSFAGGFAPSRYLALFRKAAKRQGWPEACIDLLVEIAGNAVDPDHTIAENGKRVLEVLQTHCEPEPEQADPASEEVAP